VAIDRELYQLMVDRVQDYAIFLLDPGGNIISWNSGAQRIKQYTAEEAIGQHVSIFYTDEDRARNWAQTELKRATADGRFEDEGWRVRKDGSRFWANVVITALRDENGNLRAFSKITRDLSGRKKQEEELRQSEERFRLLIEGVQDYAIYMLDPDGVVTSWNSGAQRIKGYSAAEILGKHFSRFYTDEDVENGKPWANLARARQSGRVEDEGWRVRKDGSRFWSKIILTSLHDGNGHLRGFAKVTQDLTRQHHAVALESASRRTSDFLAVLAHELRNPLAPIRNAVKAMEHVQPGERSFETLRLAIDRQSSQLSRIVDDLLDISRITRGVLDVHVERIDALDVIERAIQAAQGEIQTAGHTLEVDLPGRPLWCMGDMQRLTQALTNILHNAARYTDAGGRIDVQARAVQKGAAYEAVISVRDSGRGIDPLLLHSIFEMFVQGRDAYQRTGQGLGVGLALARSIVELHHGSIEARSEGAGRGSEFVLRLPCEGPSQETKDAREQPPSSQEAPGCARRVLVVDDNVDAAAMLAVVLRHCGHDVRIAHSGPEALQLADAFQPEVVLLDIGMPGMDGLEVARQLRKKEPQPRPLIVAITGWGASEDERRTREAGFDVHLVKPVEQAQLQRILRERTLH
jgi:PAS domain S-box-containing protein